MLWRYATGRLGLVMADVQANTTLIWPPTGLSIAAMVLLGPRCVVGIVAGAITLNLSIGTPLLPSLTIACGNALEAVAAWAMLRRFEFGASLRRMRDVGLLLLAAPIACLVSATIGVASLVTFELLAWSASDAIWLRWWAGDMLGAIVVLPLVAVIVRGGPDWEQLYRRRESWIVAALIVVGSTATFLLEIHGLARQILPFGLFVVLVWAGLRLGPRGAVLAGSVSSVIAVIGTAQGLGPFSDPHTSVRIFALWGYVTSNGAIVLVLAAAVAERESALTALLDTERERRHLETQILHVQRLESLGVLAGGVAHDFNNLLTVIRGNAGIIPLLPTAEEREACLQQIDLAAIRASQLCQQLLTYSGKARPEMQAVDLASMTEELRELLASSMSKKVELELEFDASVPKVLGDPALLQQIVLNLLINGSEAFGDEEGRVRVHTHLQTCDRAYLDSTFLPSSAAAGDYVALVVQDDGAGMDKETLSRIFDPFFSTKFSGRGLGLAAVHGVVRAHQGAIKVESSPGQGTAFTVLLPPATIDTPAKTEQPGGPRAPSGQWLIVDDEKEIRDFASRTLASVGVQSLEAVDGEAAIQTLGQFLDAIEGLVIDLTMPRKGGREVIQWVRSRRVDLPIVLMSGYRQADEEIEDVIFLPKPFGTNEFLAALREALNRP